MERHAACLLLACAGGCGTTPPPASTELAWIRTAGDGFVRADTGEPFVVWGVNYDHDARGRLLEDYWRDEWETVAEDFAEMRALGANLVRVHLQLGRFMRFPEVVDDDQLDRLRRLVALAAATGVYLDVTGLGCYHRADVPAWYDALPEAERWAVQARFWSAVARVCAPSAAVFCYDLMNEPILPGQKPERDWLAGEFAGSHFVQRIALDLAGRARTEVAERWVETMAAAIRQHDRRHLITVGVIPWAMVFPGAEPVFYSAPVARHLDFVSVHVYPERGGVDAALRALRVYAVGKPLLVEEMFPLRCDIDELCDFVDRSREQVAGWVSFYWGRRADEYDRDGATLPSALVARWLRRFAAKSAEVRGLRRPHRGPASSRSRGR